MKKIFLMLLILILGAAMMVAALIALPFYGYQQMISGQLRSEWYTIDNYDHRFLVPDEITQTPPHHISDEKNWKKFHFQDLLIPLPVKNPFYFSAPILEFDSKVNKSSTGIQLFLPSGRVISEVRFIPLKSLRYQLRSQKIFQLPLVRKIIKRIDRNKIWKDIFTKKIDNWRVPIKEMLYNLYLIQMRSWILPANFVKFQWYDDQDQLALITLESENKDFTTEIILKKHKSTIYSYSIQTRSNVDIAQAFRSKFLNSIKFREGHHSLSDIIYREFQSLSYDQKIDHEGMLYLFSAWSHNMFDKSIIREMVEYLERGEQNQKQLAPVYRYALARWGTTFSTRFIDGLTDSDIQLKRSIEHEQLATEKRLREEEVRPQKVETPMGPEEQMQDMLKRAKRNKKDRIKNGRMIID